MITTDQLASMSMEPYAEFMRNLEAQAQPYPVLLLDVDGPLNPWSARDGLPEGFTAHLTRPKGWEMGKGLKVRLRASDGLELRKLKCELIWATAWEEEANDWIGCHINLPKLPHINWIDKDHWNVERLHWKTKRIVQWMNRYRPGQPFMWLDDEITKKDRLWITDSCAEGSTTFFVSPKTGLTDEDFKKIKEWRDSVSKRTDSDSEQVPQL